MRTVFNPANMTAGGGGGPRNQIKIFNAAGSYGWKIPETIDPEVPLIVRVWGAGGACAHRLGISSRR